MSNPTATQPVRGSTPNASRVPFVLRDVEAYLENGEQSAAFFRLLAAIPALTSDAEIASLTERVRLAAKDAW